MNTLEKIFKKKENITIGVVHFPPLLGEKDFPGFDIAEANAIADIQALEKGGVDAIILENNYSVVKEFIDTPQVIAMTILAERLRTKISVPIGISALWNDYKTAFSIAVACDADFIRIPVFVDTVKPYCGIIEGNPEAVLRTQKELEAEHVAIFTDIHVKHAEHISTYTIEESAQKAIDAGSDGLIITGKWTGEAPDVTELQQLRDSVGDFPILIGSGADTNNAQELLSVANGAIISTSLKEGSRQDIKNEPQVKGYEQRVSEDKVKEFVSSL